MISDVTTVHRLSGLSGEESWSQDLYGDRQKHRRPTRKWQYEPDAYIMFGKESAGIPEEILLENQETAIRIPMINDIRSLNLEQFRGDRALRGTAPAPLRSYAAGWSSDQI